MISILFEHMRHEILNEKYKETVYSTITTFLVDTMEETMRKRCLLIIDVQTALTSQYPVDENKMIEHITKTNQGMS